MHVTRLRASQREGSLPGALLTPALLVPVPAPKSLRVEGSQGFLLCSHHTLQHLESSRKMVPSPCDQCSL